MTGFTIAGSNVTSLTGMDKDHSNRHAARQNRQIAKGIEAVRLYGCSAAS